MNPYDLDAKDQQILKLMVENPGISKVEIAKKINMSAAGLDRRMSKEGFLKAKEDLLASTQDILEKAAKLAARRLVTMIRDPDKKIAMEAIKLALAPQLNKQQIEVKKEEVIFQTRVGSQGQLMRETIEVRSEDKTRSLGTSSSGDSGKTGQDDPKDKPST